MILGTPKPFRHRVLKTHVRERARETYIERERNKKKLKMRKGNGTDARSATTVVGFGMDAEGLGRKPLPTPPCNPWKPADKHTVGTVTASHGMLTLQAL